MGDTFLGAGRLVRAASKFGLLACALMAVVGGGSQAEAQTFAPIPGISFVKPYTGSDPLPQTLTVASVGGAINFGVSHSTATGGNWLSLGGCTSYCQTPSTLTAVVNATVTLAPGYL